MMLRLSALLTLLVGFLGFVQATPLSWPDLPATDDVGLYPRQGQCRTIHTGGTGPSIRNVGDINIDRAIIYRRTRTWYPNNFLDVRINANRLSNNHPYIDIEITNRESIPNSILLSRRPFGSRTYEDIVTLRVPAAEGENPGESYVCLRLFSLSGHFYIQAEV